MSTLPENVSTFPGSREEHAFPHSKLSAYRTEALHGERTVGEGGLDEETNRDSKGGGGGCYETGFARTQKMAAELKKLVKDANRRLDLPAA